MSSICCSIRDTADGHAAGRQGKTRQMSGVKCVREGGQRAGRDGVGRYTQGKAEEGRERGRREGQGGHRRGKESSKHCLRKRFLAMCLDVLGILRKNKGRFW